MIPRFTELAGVSAQMITIADGSDFAGTVNVDVKTGAGAWGAAFNSPAAVDNGSATITLIDSEMNAEMILVRFKGTGAITSLVTIHTTPKQAYDNWEQHFDNGAAASTVQLDQLALEATGQSTLSVVQALNDFNPSSDVVIANVQWWQGVELTGANMIEDAAVTPKWTIDALINGPSGAGSGNITHILGTALAESNGTLAAGFNKFFDVAVPAKDMNEVGSGTLLLPQTFLSVASSGQTTGTHEDTHVIDTQVLSVAGNIQTMTLDYNIGSANTPFEFNIVSTVTSNGSTTGVWEVRDFTDGSWEQIRLIANTGIETVHTVRTDQLNKALTPEDYVEDGTGIVRYQFTTPAHASGLFDVDYANVLSATAGGSVPTPSEIAQATEALQAGIHGDRAWTGDYTAPATILAVNGLEIDVNASTGGIQPGMFFLVRDSAGNQFAGEYIVNFQPDTPSAGQSRVTILEALPFTVLPGMQAEFRLNPPVVVEALTGNADQEIRDAMKLAPTAGAPAAGSVDEHLDLIYADTQATLVNTGSIETKLDSVLVDTGSIEGKVDQIIVDIGNQNDLSAADVNAEVLDVMRTDTFSEPPKGAPPFVTSMGEKLDYLYKAWRNEKDQSPTEWSLYNAGATVVDQRAGMSHNGGTDTTTKGEIISGA